MITTRSKWRRLHNQLRRETDKLLLQTSFYYLTKFTQNELLEAVYKDECSVCNDQWTERYFFTDVGVKAVCLICHETLAVFKEYNLKRHFQTKHANFGHNLSKQELQKKTTDLVKSLKQQQTVFEKTSIFTKERDRGKFCVGQ